MKKIFTILALGAVMLGSAFSGYAEMKSMSLRDMNPEMLQVMREKSSETLKAMANGEELPETPFATRAYVDPNGNMWSIVMMKRFPLAKMFASSTAPELTEEEYLMDRPFWAIECDVQGLNSEGKLRTSAAFMLFWPCYKMWNASTDADSLDIVSPFEFASGGKVVDSDIPTAQRFEYMVPEPGYIGIVDSDETTGWISKYGMQWLVHQNYTALINGVEVPKTPSGSSEAPLVVGSSVQFNNVEVDEGQSIYNIQTMANYSMSGVSASLSNNYVGTITSRLVPAEYKFDIGHANLWFVRKDFSSDVDIEEKNLYDGEWGPFSQYYFGLSNKNAIVLPNDEKTSGAFDYKEIFNYLTSAEGRLDAEYVRGMMFAPNGDAMEVPTGKFTVAVPEERKLSSGLVNYELTPTANMLVPNGEPYTSKAWAMTSDGLSDGLYCNLGGLATFPRNPSYVQFGTTEGLRVWLKDANGDVFRGSYTGEIQYAKDPSDMYQFTKVSAYGPDEPDASIEGVNAEGISEIGVGNGAIEVYASENADVVVYGVNGMVYANDHVRAGQTKTIALSDGMYVVKVGNTTKKVVL